MSKRLIYPLLLILFFSCSERKVAFQLNNCKTTPAFIRKLSGFNPRNSYFSTSEIRKMGLVLAEVNIQAGSARPQYYQHPSWKKGGWLAPIVLDETGNIYTAPAPFINALDNPLKDQNTIYKVNAQTGVMDEFMHLPAPDSLTQNNAYGIIGMIYLCESGVLYVSTVLGSDRHIQRGGLYAIDVKNKKIIDRITARDIMGLGITYITGQRKLFFGSGRSPDVFSITLNKDGRFKDDPKKEFSLTGLGTRGDDKVRRIITDNDGNLEIHAIEFNYNLIAPREKQEGNYLFIYDDVEKKWKYSLPHH